MTWRPYASPDDTHQFVRRCEASWDSGAAFSYAICFLQERAPFSMIGIHPVGGRVNSRYIISPPHWGNGYATEALAMLVEWALDQDGIWRAGAYCDIDTPASARVT